MLAARVEQKNGTYLNNIQRDRQSSASPTPVAVFGICPDRHSHALDLKNVTDMHVLSADGQTLIKGQLKSTYNAPRDTVDGVTFDIL